ncbi:hypothetical protein LJC16_00355 [Bacteroidales bacterium OttesenSCG-928-C19]|nr:hypothetical protein [Bacteroidales bacterium OttesenSCG-928-C19]
MENKIQELTDKLYQEGVEKGELEAARIIREANEEKIALLEKAQKKADEIIANAQKAASELTKNTESELKLYTKQAVEAIKSEVTNLITDKVASSAVQSAFDGKDFMQKMLLSLVSEWAKNEKLVIGTSDADTLRTYFEANAKDLLDKGLKIEQINGKLHSFTIAPADGTYKITFGEEEFIAYFKEFLRPQLIDLLF